MRFNHYANDEQELANFEQEHTKNYEPSVSLRHVMYVFFLSNGCFNYANFVN